MKNMCKNCTYYAIDSTMCLDCYHHDRFIGKQNIHENNLLFEPDMSSLKQDLLRAYELVSKLDKQARKYHGTEMVMLDCEDWSVLHMFLFQACESRGFI